MSALGSATLVPETTNVPLFYLSVDPSQAGNNTQDQPVLLIGQMLASGTATPNVPIAIGDISIAQAQFGVGSILERMFAAFFANNTTSLVYALPITDPQAAVAATGAVTMTAQAAASGVIPLYIAGQKVAINAYTSDTLAMIATRLAAAINSISTLPLTAAASGAAVNLTHKHKGDLSNDCPISFCYLGNRGNEALPLGFAATITPMSGGTGQPDFTTPLANMAAGSYVHVALPYSDGSSLDDFDTEFGFVTGRWAYQRQDYGWIYNAVRTSYASGLTFGNQNNSAVISTLAIEPTTASTVYETAAAYCAVGAYALLADAARPLQTLELLGILPAPTQDRFSTAELNIFGNHGLATQRVNSNGRVCIARETLQYQLNSFGQSDTSLNLITDLSNLSALIIRMRAAITTKYPRHKLAADGTRYGAGAAIVTPLAIKGELVAEAISAVFDGLMQDIADFTTNLIVEIDDQNPNRVNVLWPPKLMAGLRIFAVQAQFRK